MKLFIALVLSVLTFSVFSQQYKPVDANSDVNFTIKNFGINTPGSLKGLKGTINFNPADVASSSFSVSVDVNTINTGVDARDNHLKEEEYFDVKKYPVITFSSANIKKDENGYLVTGNLTIKGVTKAVSFPFTVENQNNGILLNGNFSINRKDFNVGGSSAVLGNSVNVSLKVFAIKG
jgi:polyisoprenoid-binding protein YceI